MYIANYFARVFAYPLVDIYTFLQFTVPPLPPPVHLIGLQRCWAGSIPVSETREHSESGRKAFPHGTGFNYPT